MTDSVKKSTTRKPRATAVKSATPAETAPKKKTTKSKVTAMKASPEQIALLAHRYWLERGGGHGNDADDWFRAEQELLGKAS